MEVKSICETQNMWLKCEILVLYIFSVIYHIALSEVVTRAFPSSLSILKANFIIIINIYVY